MKHAWKWLLICAAVVLPWDARANLLTNPGFETGDYTGWSQWQPLNTTINNWGQTGSFSAAGWWQASGWEDISIANPSLTYTVGGWIFDDVAGGESLTGGEFASIRVEFKDATDNIIGTWTTGNLTGANLLDNTWNNRTGLITPSSFGTGITKATLVWEVNNTGTGSGRGIFDNLTIEALPVPEASSLTMLSMGLLGLAGLNYRKKLKKNG